MRYEVAQCVPGLLHILLLYVIFIFFNKAKFITHVKRHTSMTPTLDVEDMQD